MPLFSSNPFHATAPIHHPSPSSSTSGGDYDSSANELSKLDRRRSSSKGFGLAPEQSSTGGTSSSVLSQRRRSSVFPEQQVLLGRRQSTLGQQQSSSKQGRRLSAVEASPNPEQLSPRSSEENDRAANVGAALAALNGTSTPNRPPTGLFTTPDVYSSRRRSLRLGEDAPARPPSLNHPPVHRSSIDKREPLFSNNLSLPHPFDRPYDRPDHVTLTLAQRRRSSLLRPIGIDTRAGNLLSGLFPSSQKLDSPAPSSARRRSSTYSPSTSPTKESFKSNDSTPRSATFNQDEMGLYVKDGGSARRNSAVLSMLDGSDSSLYKRAAGTRKLRKAITRIVGLIVLAIFISKGIGRSYPSVDVFSSIDLESIPGLDTMTTMRHPKSSGAARKKPFGKDQESEAAKFRSQMIWGAAEETLETMIIKEKPGSAHEETVIYLHGLLQHSWDTPLPQQLGERFPSVRWVMPQAPSRPVTVRDNDTVPSWFDMKAFPYDNAQDEDPDRLYESARMLNAVLVAERSELIKSLRERGGMDSLPERERVYVGQDVDDVPDGALGNKAEREWASSRIVLAGFSQGSVMTLLTGLTFKDRLAGLVVLSGFMPLRARLASFVNDLDRTTLPVFWGHGMQDIYLTHEDALQSVKLLQSPKPLLGHQGGLGLTQIEFHSYPGLDHSWFPGEMDHLANWMERIFPSQRVPRTEMMRKAK
ncbi:alpha/beta-hydrolase [Meredithblackwellia eburnea MCA 4105]